MSDFKSAWELPAFILAILSWLVAAFVAAAAAGYKACVAELRVASRTDDYGCTGLGENVAFFGSLTLAVVVAAAGAIVATALVRATRRNIEPGGGFPARVAVVTTVIAAGVAATALYVLASTPLAG